MEHQHRWSRRWVEKESASVTFVCPSHAIPWSPCGNVRRMWSIHLLIGSPTCCQSSTPIEFMGNALLQWTLTNCSLAMDTEYVFLMRLERQKKKCGWCRDYVVFCFFSQCLRFRLVYRYKPALEKPFSFVGTQPPKTQLYPLGVWYSKVGSLHIPEDWKMLDVFKLYPPFFGGWVGSVV